MKLIAAVKLYELGCLSSGAAPNWAGIHKILLLTKLASYDTYTFQLTEAELVEEIKPA